MAGATEILGLQSIVANANKIMASLEAIKTQHHQELSSLQPSKGRGGGAGGARVQKEKAEQLRNSLEKVQLGIDEAQVVVSLARHFHMLEGEKEKLIAQVARLSEENSCLRDQLNETKTQLEESDAKVIVLEEENEHLQFLKRLKQYDEDEGNDEVDSGVAKKAEEGPAQDDEQQVDFSVSEGQGEGGEQTYTIPPRLRTLHNLVIQYASQGRYEVAVPLCKQALDDLENTLGHNHPDVATMLNILALVYRDNNNFKEACRLLQESLTIREKTLGVNHPAVAATLNNLAVLHGKLGNYALAEPYCKRALVIREKALGKEHPDVAKQLNNLALVCQNQGKFEEVEAYYARAAHIYRSQLGEDDPNVAKTMNNLASSYLKQGKFKAAENLYRDVLERAYSREFGNDSGLGDAGFSPFSSQDKAARLTGDRRSASHVTTRPSTTSAYAEYGGWHRSSTADSPTVHTTLKNLSSLYRRQGKFEAAESIEQCALRSRKQALQVVKQAKVTEMLGAEATARRPRSGSLSAPQTPEGEVKGEKEPKLKRKGSFSKLKGSVGKALNKLTSSSPSSPSDSKEPKRRRSSSLPRQLLGRSGSAERLVDKEKEESPRQQPILAESGRRSRPMERGRRSRGPLKATH